MKLLLKNWVLMFGLAAVVFWIVRQQGIGVADTSLPETWSQDFAAAQAVAQQEQKPMLLAFSASWCGPCKSMKARVYPHPKVAQTLDGWMPVYIDGDKFPEITRQFQVQAYPTYVVLSPEGNVAGAWRGGTTVNSFVGKVTNAAKTWQTEDR